VTISQGGGRVIDVSPGAVSIEKPGGHDTFDCTATVADEVILPRPAGGRKVCTMQREAFAALYDAPSRLTEVDGKDLCVALSYSDPLMVWVTIRYNVVGSGISKEWGCGNAGRLHFPSIKESGAAMERLKRRVTSGWPVSIMRSQFSRGPRPRSQQPKDRFATEPSPHGDRSKREVER
jgi:hypothetical protein